MRSDSTATDPATAEESASSTVPVASAARPGIAPDGSAGRAAGGSDARIARLFEMTNALLATISLDGRFTLLNPAWEQALGRSREERQATPMRDLLHPDDVGQTLALLLAGSHHPAHLENFTNRY